MVQQQIDADAFNAFEKEGWGPASAPYTEAFGSLTSQAIPGLLDAVGTGPGVRLLDVASGPGWVSAAAAERGASTVGLDISVEMLAEARRRYPALQFQEGSAEELPFAPEEFDAVVMNFCVLHLGRPERALQEAHRVLRPGAKVGFTVWDTPDKAVGFGLILQAVEAHGRTDVGLPPGPPLFRFSDARESERTLLESGFAAPTVTTVPQVWRWPTADLFFEAMYQGTVRTHALLHAQSPEALAAIRAVVIDGAQAYRTADGGVEIPMPAVLSSATKP